MSARGARSCLLDGSEEIPGCGTGPLGRLSWVLRELVGTLHRRSAPRHKEETTWHSSLR
ncbi:MAG: hypothetical protein M0Z46_20870 [Actinomycetota bacterium]|nr:hypothetical protein [Actinomycetota bacterium]